VDPPSLLLQIRLASGIHSIIAEMALVQPLEVKKVWILTHE